MSTPALPFKVESKQIGKFAYKATQLDAVTGRRAFHRLVRAIGPAWAAMTHGGEERYEKALTKLLQDMSEADLDFFCDTFAAVTEVSGGSYGKRAPQLDTVFLTHFAGEYFDMVQWLVFCMKLNFASFFAGAAALLASKAPSDSTSPTEQTGSSGV